MMYGTDTVLMKVAEIFKKITMAMVGMMEIVFLLMVKTVMDLTMQVLEPHQMVQIRK